MENLDLTTEDGVKRNANCDAIKKANDGFYPGFWYRLIVLSGVAREVSTKFER